MAGYAVLCKRWWRTATEKLAVGAEITAACVEGDTDFFYQGRLKHERTEQSLGEILKASTKIMMTSAWLVKIS